MAKKEEKKNAVVEFCLVAKDLFLKPSSTVKKEEKRFKDPKNTWTLAGVVAVVMVILQLIETLFNTVYVNTSVFNDKKEFFWDKLQDVNWFDVTIKQLFMVMASMLAITLIYYLASLIIKKSVSFTKFVLITTIAFMPIVLASTIVGPLLGMVSPVLYTISIIAGGIYGVMILISLSNEEIKLKDSDEVIYYNFVTLTIMFSSFLLVLVNTLDIF